MEEKNKLLDLAQSPFKFQLFLLTKLPAAFFSGIKIKEINKEKCITSVPFTWLTQNPFRSTYFASLAMAAEMSTGVLALLNTYKKSPPISMLVTKMEATYFKKAKGITFFTCTEGSEIATTVNKAASGKVGQTVTVKSTGRNKGDELIAEFLFTWSFKAK
ncbi:MAG: DUF4442 domain-containing protein [Bacteroidota bacterium]|nr:DUF4442 domain-containing protein [Bacteroidota bacterium]